MDGGRVLRAVLAMRLGPQRATEIAAKLGQFFAFLFVAVGLFLSPMLIFVGLFIYIAAVSELAAANMLRRFAEGLTVGEGMRNKPFAAYPKKFCCRRQSTLCLPVPSALFRLLTRSRSRVGLLERDDLLRGLKEKGPDATVTSVSRNRL